MVDVGFAVTEFPVDALKVAAGLHVKFVAPPAVSVAEAPAQMVALFTVSVGFEMTVTLAVVEAVQLPEVPVIV